MEDKSNLIDPLLSKAEQYGKTNLELLKLKSVDKTSDVLATLVSRILTGTVILMFILTFNIAIALWIGDALGKNLYGFLIVSAFYALLAIILLIAHPSVKSKLKNIFITQFLN